MFPLVRTPAKSRAIAIPVDLDSQVNNLFVKSNNVVQKSILNWRLSAKNTRRDSGLPSSKDYRNIIERLQVSLHCALCSTQQKHHRERTPIKYERRLR